MSCYESEWGTISLTKTGYMQMIRAMRKAYNQYITGLHTEMLEIHQALSKINGRGAAEKRKQTFRDWTGSCQYHGLNVIERPGRHGAFKLTSQHRDKLSDELFRGRNGTLTKPRKSAFKTLTNKEVAFTLMVSYDADFTFEQHRDGTGQIAWHVSENNHAVDRAKESMLYDLVMGVINAYKFKRNEGGIWYYESEYTRDGAKESGCGDTTSESATFGPIGKQHTERKMKALRAMYR